MGVLLDSGAALSSAADTLADVFQRQEVSKVRTGMAQMRADWTVEMQKRATESEIGDPDFAEKFNTDFGEALAKHGENIRTPAGRQAFKETSAEMAAHFTQAAGLYQAKSMGDRAVLDYKSTLDANRNTLVMEPGLFDAVLADSERGLADPNGIYAKMGAGKRAELAETTRKELALSAVQGMINADPEAALQELNNGKWAQYLDADKTVALKRNAEISIRANELERDRIERAKEKAQKAAATATETEFITKLVEDSTSLSPVDVARSNLSPDDKIKWLNILKGKPEVIRTVPEVYLDVYERIQLPPDDPRYVSEDMLPAFVGKGLTLENVNSFRMEASGRKTEAGQIEHDLKDGLVKLAKSSLTGSDPLFRLRDPKGDEQLQKFMTWFLPEYSAQRKAGKSAVELLNPESPAYLGKALEQYKRTPAQFLKDMMENNPGADVFGVGPTEMPAPKTPEDRDALPKGTRYRAPDGSVRVK